MPRYLYGKRKRVEPCQCEPLSSNFAVIQPVGDLVGVITPFATHPICWNARRTSPFSQRHRMHIDKFA